MRQVAEVEPPGLLRQEHVLQHERRRRAFAEGRGDELAVFGATPGFIRPAEVDVLIVEGVRQLVSQDHPLDERGHRGGPIDEAQRPGRGLVVARDLLVEDGEAGHHQVESGGIRPTTRRNA